jgi:hypothetical protein
LHVCNFVNGQGVVCGKLAHRRKDHPHRKGKGGKGGGKGGKKRGKRF